MLSESKQLVMENSREVILRKNLTRQNGKEKCFICLNDTNPPEEKLIEESDCLSLYYNKKTKYMLFNSNSKQGNGNKLSNCSNQIESVPNQNLIIPIRLNTKNIHNTYLFSPCKCDKLAHMTCLTNYCIMNISLKCNKCHYNYPIEFIERKSKLMLALGIILSTFFILIHSGIFLVLFLLFFGYFDFPKMMEHMEYVIGSLFFVVNIFLMILSYNISRKILKEKILKPKFMNDKEFSKDKKMIDPKIGSNFYTFMMNSHKCGKLDLLEKKINNKIFTDGIIKDNMKISQFIKDNNNVCYVKRYATTHNVNEDVSSINKFNKSNLFSKRSSMRSYNHNENEMRRQISSHVNPKISDKNFYLNFNADKEKNSFIQKSKTKNSKNVNEEGVSRDKVLIREIEEEKEWKEIKFSNIPELSKINETESPTNNLRNLDKTEDKLTNIKTEDDTVLTKKNEKVSSSGNLNKDRAHKKKLSINNNLRMMDNSKVTTVENFLKKKINENSNKFNLSVEKILSEVNDEPINSRTLLNVDDII